MPLLEISNLNLAIAGKKILDNISLTLDEGQVIGLVGESGSGKSLTALSIMRLLPRAASLAGSIRFAGEELVKADEAHMCALRGDDIGMVFQEPMTALNPLKTIGEQVAEGIRLHRKVSPAQAWQQATDILAEVGLPAERFPLSRYPHELSGGQRQRVGIAIACALRPRLLIADEPTTALDVTIQAQILELLLKLVKSHDMALLLISHDLAVVAGIADRVCVLRNGQVKESGDAVTVLTERRHAYTRRLAEASSHVPARTAPPILSSQASGTPLLSAVDLHCTYPRPRTSLFKRPPPFNAVDGVSFAIHPGQTMALVGESGCGKSTLARAILGLHKDVTGKLVFDGNDLVGGGMQAIQEARKEMQIVFQDPYGSFNPRHKVGRLLAEPLFLRPELDKAEKKRRTLEALTDVGLLEEDGDKYVHEFSGGQRQRLAIARALVNRPRLIIADEPVSALDVSIRAQILDLLADLRGRHGLAYLFISHDLSVVRALCDEVIVMRHGQFVEQGAVQQVFDAPAHAYTRQLLAASPELEQVLAERRKSRA
ncbi:MAG: dipeptide ABC transporter ATP-binding protein [Rhizobiaceae bacterium]